MAKSKKSRGKESKQVPNPIDATSTVLITRVKTASTGAQFMTKCIELGARVIVFTDSEEGEIADIKRLSTDDRKRLFAVKNINVRKLESLVTLPKELAALKNAPTEVTHVIDADAAKMGFVSVDGTVCLSKAVNTNGHNCIFQALLECILKEGAIWAVIPESGSLPSPRVSTRLNKDEGIKITTPVGVVAVLPGIPGEDRSKKNPAEKLSKEENVAEMLARICETEVGTDLRIVDWKGVNANLERFTANTYHVPATTPRNKKKSSKSEARGTPRNVDKKSEKTNSEIDDVPNSSENEFTTDSTVAPAKPDSNGTKSPNLIDNNAVVLVYGVGSEAASTGAQFVKHCLQLGANVVAVSKNKMFDFKGLDEDSRKRLLTISREDLGKKNSVDNILNILKEKHDGKTGRFFPITHVVDCERKKLGFVSANGGEVCLSKDAENDAATKMYYGLQSALREYATWAVVAPAGGSFDRPSASAKNNEGIKLKSPMGVVALVPSRGERLKEEIPAVVDRIVETEAGSKLRITNAQDETIVMEDYIVAKYASDGEQAALVQNSTVNIETEEKQEDGAANSADNGDIPAKVKAKREGKRNSVNDTSIALMNGAKNVNSSVREKSAKVKEEDIKNPFSLIGSDFKETIEMDMDLDVEMEYEDLEGFPSYSRLENVEVDFAEVVEGRTSWKPDIGNTDTQKLEVGSRKMWKEETSATPSLVTERRKTESRVTNNNKNTAQREPVGTKKEADEVKMGVESAAEQVTSVEIARKGNMAVTERKRDKDPPVKAESKEKPSARDDEAKQAAAVESISTTTSEETAVKVNAESKEETDEQNEAKKATAGKTETTAEGSKCAWHEFRKEFLRSGTKHTVISSPVRKVENEPFMRKELLDEWRAALIGATYARQYKN